MHRNRLLLLALALSLLVHGLLLLWHRTQNLNASGARQEVAGDLPLAVTLAPPPPKQGPVASPRPETAPPAHRAAPPRHAPPPVISTPRPTPLPAPPPLAQPAPPAPLAPPTPPGDAPAPPMDMMAQLNAVRQRRREAASPSPAPDAPPTEDQRALGNALRNLRSLTPGQDEGTNGVFSITRMGYTSAEFTFRGWNTNFRRNWNESISVERGSNPDIQLAVVRKMIEIIRRYETRDFVWESRRLGRNVTLSARPEDTAGLEDFLLKEFFPEYRG